MENGQLSLGWYGGAEEPLVEPQRCLLGCFTVEIRVAFFTFKVFFIKRSSKEMSIVFFNSNMRRCRSCVFSSFSVISDWKQGAAPEYVFSRFKMFHTCFSYTLNFYSSIIVDCRKICWYIRDIDFCFVHPSWCFCATDRVMVAGEVQQNARSKRSNGGVDRKDEKIGSCCCCWK